MSNIVNGRSRQASDHRRGYSHVCDANLRYQRPSFPSSHHDHLCLDVDLTTDSGYGRVGVFLPTSLQLSDMLRQSIADEQTERVALIRHLDRIDGILKRRQAVSRERTTTIRRQRGIEGQS